tara:strand:- start:130044 stop:130991 length:948 start_codon:yes stop_codon:yes gene_type:complete
MRLLFKKGALFYAFFNLRLFFFLLFRRSDILLSNDLDTLLANFIASRIKRKARLVYDSHELFTEVPELTSRPKVRKVWLRIEKWIFPKLKYVYTVNQSIAEIYQNRYNKDVGVIRNVSRLWKPKTIEPKEELKIPVNKKMIILQGAGINIDRGGEEAVEAMQYIENAVLFIVGSGDVIGQLKQTVRELSLKEKVFFVDRVPYDNMMNYTYHADIGLTLDKDTNPNYKYSLPNKVFDYIHTETPVISSNIIEIKRIIQKYNMGKIIDDHNPKHLASTISEVLVNDELLEELKKNCKIASQHENWEKEKKKLKQYFP